MLKVTRFLFLLVIMLFVHAAFSFSRGNKKSLLKWLTPQQTDLLYNQEERPIIVDVYTDWCHYCKVMDNTTWRNDSVVDYLTKNFYPVKLDAENKQPYEWQGVKYDYEPRYKVNMLAVKLLQGNMVYPSVVIIPVKGEPEVIRGAFSPKELEMILKYYGDRTNEQMSPEDYMKQFSGKWK